MARSLTAKLILAFVLVAAITGLVLALVFRSLNATHFDDFVLDQQSDALVTQLQIYYQENGSWDALSDAMIIGEIDPSTTTVATVPVPGGMDMGTGQGRGWQGGMGMGSGRGNMPRAGESRRLFGLADADGKVVIPVNQYRTVGDTVPTTELNQGVPITVDGQQVGTLLRVNRLPGYSTAEAVFLQRTNTTLLLAILGAILIAGLIGVLIARSLTRPLKQLTTAVERVSPGQPAPQVAVTSRDEIGELSQAFNQMSADLERSTQIRRQLTADIAHDLRTPLTVIGGYIESMRDGVLSPTPERLTLIYAEIERLKRMVGDLRTLSMADSGEISLQCQPLTPSALLEQAAALFRPLAMRKGVELTVSASETLPAIRGDEMRLMQVMENLLANALRYTPAGGNIRLSAKTTGSHVLLRVQDSGSGIPAEELPYIFERFQKGDKARTSEDDSGSGLGLAIVKALVEAHGGRVTVASTAGSGSVFTVMLPVYIPKN